MTTLTLRNVKGSPLTNDEIDANFVSLNVEKVERGANLSDLADAATCRSNLGLVIGAQVQAFDADLAAIAGLAGTSGFLTKTAANTWALDTNNYLTTVSWGSVTGKPTTIGGFGITDAVTTDGDQSINGSKSFSGHIGILGQPAMTGSWTTVGWNRGISLQTGSVVWWPKGITNVSVGIGKTNDDNLYFVSSTADTGAAASYKFIFNMNTGVLSADAINVNGSPCVTDATIGSKSANYATTAGRARPLRDDGSAWDLWWSNPGGQPLHYLGSDDGVTVRPYACHSLSVNYANQADKAHHLNGGTIQTMATTWNIGSIYPAATQIMGDTTYAAGLTFHRAGAYAINFGLDNDNVVRLGGYSHGDSVWRMQVDQAGTLTATGNVVAYSDERLKKNWQDLPKDTLERLAKIRVGTYERIDTEGVKQVGVSAQSLQKVMPDAVIEQADGILGVSYGNAALAACVLLSREVVELRAELAGIKRWSLLGLLLIAGVVLLGGHA